MGRVQRLGRRMGLIDCKTADVDEAARFWAGLTRDELATRAGLSRDVPSSWEVSSESIVPAQYQSP
jgi:hypothetical protein